MTARDAADTTHAMTKTAFLAELQRRLNVLPESEARAATAYYDEYLSEAGPENEAAAIAELGSPAQVAAGILGDQVYADTTGEQKSIKKGLGALWLVVAGLLLVSPLGWVLVPLVISLLLAAFALVFSFFILAVSLLVGGIIYLGIGSFTLFFSFSTGLVTIGSGLMSAAVGTALMIAMIWLTKHIVNGIARGGSHLLRKFKSRREAQYVS